MADFRAGIGTLRVVESREDSGSIIHVFGDIDAYTAPRLRMCLMTLIERGERSVVVDLVAARLVDSTGLGVLVAVLKRMEGVGGRLILRSPRTSVRRVLDLTGLDRVFTVVG